MQYYFLNIIDEAKRGNKDSLLSLIEKFDPKLKKLSRQLNYEEAKTDMVIAFIEIVQSLDLDSFKDKSEGIVVNYISKSLEHKKVDLFRKYIKNTNEEIELNFDIVSYSEINERDRSLFISELLNSLTQLQRKIIEYRYFKCYSDVEIAVKLQISRQAVNRIHKRALEKARIYIEISNEKGVFLSGDKSYRNSSLAGGMGST